MTRFFLANAVRIFDYPEFASKLRDRVRERAASLAAEVGMEIEHIAESRVRKETVVAKVLEARGEQPGLGACDPGDGSARRQSALARQDDAQDLRASGQRQMLARLLPLHRRRSRSGYLRVPTRAPFRLPFSCNGHSWLARD